MMTEEVESWHVCVVGIFFFLFLWRGGWRKHWTEIKVNYPELMMSTVSFQLVHAGGVHTYIH